VGGMAVQPHLEQPFMGLMGRYVDCSIVG